MQAPCDRVRPVGESGTIHARLRQPSHVAARDLVGPGGGGRESSDEEEHDGGRTGGEARGGHAAVRPRIEQPFESDAGDETAEDSHRRRDEADVAEILHHRPRLVERHRQPRSKREEQQDCREQNEMNPAAIDDERATEHERHEQHAGVDREVEPRRQTECGVDPLAQAGRAALGETALEIGRAAGEPAGVGAHDFARPAADQE